MGLLDKILGRGKKPAGDMTGDASMQHEGAAQEPAKHEELAPEQQPQAAETHANDENA